MILRYRIYVVSKTNDTKQRLKRETHKKARVRSFLWRVNFMDLNGNQQTKEVRESSMFSALASIKSS